MEGLEYVSCRYEKGAFGPFVSFLFFVGAEKRREGREGACWLGEGWRVGGRDR